MLTHQRQSSSVSNKPTTSTYAFRALAYISPGPWFDVHGAAGGFHPEQRKV
jgi:hypothetical protein